MADSGIADKDLYLKLSIIRDILNLNLFRYYEVSLTLEEITFITETLLNEKVYKMFFLKNKIFITT